MNCKGNILVLAVCLGMGAGTATCAAGSGASPWRLSAGYPYTSGDYGGSQTITKTYVPVTGAYRSRSVAIRLTVPYVSVTGPATIIGDTTGEFALGPGGTHSGLGDVLFSGTIYDLAHSEAARLHLDLTATVKFGTAHASEGLGTGENDYAVQLDAL